MKILSKNYEFDFENIQQYIHILADIKQSFLIALAECHRFVTITVDRTLIKL